MGKTPSPYHPHVVGPVLGDGGVGGEGEVFVVSCVVACCLLVQCVLEIAALFLVTGCHTLTFRLCFDDQRNRSKGTFIHEQPLFLRTLRAISTRVASSAASFFFF